MPKRTITVVMELHDGVTPEELRPYVLPVGEAHNGVLPIVLAEGNLNEEIASLVKEVENN